MLITLYAGLDQICEHLRHLRTNPSLVFLLGFLGVFVP